MENLFRPEIFDRSTQPPDRIYTLTSVLYFSLNKPFQCRGTLSKHFFFTIHNIFHTYSPLPHAFICFSAKFDFGCLTGIRITLPERVMCCKKPQVSRIMESAFPSPLLDTHGRYREEEMAGREKWRKWRGYVIGPRKREESREQDGEIG